MSGEVVIQRVGARTSERAAELERRFAELVATHRDRALRLAWRLVGGDAAAAEDVTQEAFVRAWRGLPRFRGEAQLSTWLYRIVVHQAATTGKADAILLASLLHDKQMGIPGIKTYLNEKGVNVRW